MTPAQWVEMLSTRDIKITERTLRERANRLGARCKLGNAMIITPSQMDRILMESQQCRSKPTSADPYNAAMARFMFETGARIDQAVSIEPDDLRPETCEVRIKAQKGHAESWIAVSPEMMAELEALQPKRPKNLKTGQLLSPRVFGYGSPTGYNNRWKTICKRAGIPYLSAHPAGRHGFFTELVVRQGVDPVTAAKAGRWSDPNLPMRI